MIEVEVKVKAPEDAVNRILAIGAELLVVENHRDLYFNGQKDFSKSDEALRIRIKDQSTNLTYKGPKLDDVSKSRLEISVGVSDPVAMEFILNSLGFHKVTEVRKQRTKYRLGEAIIALDNVSGLGTFIEVEMPASDDWQSKLEVVQSILCRLGTGESIRRSYLELLLDKGSEALDEHDYTFKYNNVTEGD